MINSIMSYKTSYVGGKTLHKAMFTVSIEHSLTLDYMAATQSTH